mmetsp:Transcript_6703/g.25094  ORF Transcript_6703/g.25094 Transcript_6703/m.25094 type:complete len:128 (+) Transcript_6703:2761-3144(+)
MHYNTDRIIYEVPAKERSALKVATGRPPSPYHSAHLHTIPVTRHEGLFSPTRSRIRRRAYTDDAPPLSQYRPPRTEKHESTAKTALKVFGKFIGRKPRHKDRDLGHYGHHFNHRTPKGIAHTLIDKF